MLCFMSCKDNSKNDTESDTQIDTTTEAAEEKTEVHTPMVRNYVDQSYPNRSQGDDWVAVIAKENPDNTMSISVRSRADKKKPTCTFDAKAFKQEGSTYESYFDGKKIVYTITDESITITTENKSDEDALSFFCSGGANFAGTYSRLNDPLDASQIDKTSFTKILELQDIGFNVSAIEKGGSNKLTVFAYGLDTGNYDETFDIGDSSVVDAEVNDLNSDGSPELLVYTQSNSPDKKGNVLAFSVNNKKSMSMVYFQPTSENKKIREGYRGNDQFTLVENKLVQKFPIYNASDELNNPTGGTRQVSYKLVEGEASRKLEVDTITKY